MTDITDFEDIRPYNDTEVRTVLDRLVETEPVVLKKRVLYQSTSYDNAVSVVTSH